MDLDRSDPNQDSGALKVKVNICPLSPRGLVSRSTTEFEGFSVLEPKSTPG